MAEKKNKDHDVYKLRVDRFVWIWQRAQRGRNTYSQAILYCRLYLVVDTVELHHEPLVVQSATEFAVFLERGPIFKAPLYSIIRGALGIWFWMGILYERALVLAHNLTSGLIQILVRAGKSFSDA